MSKSAAQILAETTRRLSNLHHNNKNDEEINEVYEEALEASKDKKEVIEELDDESLVQITLKKTSLPITPTNKNEKDYKLIQQALSGSQKAYEGLMDRYWNSVFFTILPMVNYNEPDAEGLTQEAFSKAFNRLEEYRPEYAFSTWLIRISINNTIDFIRKKRLQTLSIDKPINTKEGDSMAFSVSSLEPDPEESIIKSQRLNMVRMATSKLNPKYRKLIQLRYFKEYSYAEIAEEMELPLGTVKAELHRAKQLLQAILENPDKSF